MVTLGWHWTPTSWSWVQLCSPQSPRGQSSSLLSEPVQFTSSSQILPDPRTGFGITWPPEYPSERHTTLGDEKNGDQGKPLVTARVEYGRKFPFFKLYYYYIPEKNLPILCHWGDRTNKELYWTMTFTILHRNPNPAFQKIAEAQVLCVYVILSFISSALYKSRAVAICPADMKRKNSQCKGRVKMVVSCQKST